jgi:hypothetical protein
MKRFTLSLIYMLMLLPGLVSVAMMLFYAARYFGGDLPGANALQGGTVSWWQMLVLWIACFVISGSGWRLLRRLYANADRY